MDRSRNFSSVLLPESKHAFEILPDSHTQFVFEGFKIYPRNEKFPDDFGLIICGKNHIPSLMNFLQPFEIL